MSRNPQGEPRTEAHPVYPGGPPCNPHCPGDWSQYHDGYSYGHEVGERYATREAEAAAPIEGLREAAMEATERARQLANEGDPAAAMWATLALTYATLAATPQPTGAAALRAIESPAHPETAE